MKKTKQKTTFRDINPKLLKKKTIIKKWNFTYLLNQKTREFSLKT